MSDLIRREDALGAIVRQTNIDNVDGIRYECRRNYEKDNGWLGGLKDALNVVEDLPSAEPETKWIPVSERLPEDEEIYAVRVILKNGRVNWNRAWFDGMTWHGSGMVPEVTHWMKVDLEVEE